ncbi:MAG: phosphatase PAP2 family protein [Zoogloeaceae bacterium]|jgi:undecaprenyl-diphosphatase|nr:phosphatase PAP2 family protein [Zoogloeaceae bacterium]
MNERNLNRITFMGTPPFYFLLSLPLLLFSTRIFLVYYVSILATEIVCAVIKLLTRTDRPTPRKRVTLYDAYDASTFPSAHTARIASNTSIIALCFWSLPLAAFALVLTLAVAYSRVGLKHHFLVDVLVGAVVGVAISALTFFWLFPGSP